MNQSQTFSQFRQRSIRKAQRDNMGEIIKMGVEQIEYRNKRVPDTVAVKNQRKGRNIPGT